MEVFRISLEKYALKLMASGAAARWNQERQLVLYTGSSRSLASLELVVHRSSILTNIPYLVMVISISDDRKLYTEIKEADLPENWRFVTSYSKLQSIGADWYNKKSSLILKVPSALIPQESNYIINTEHQDFNEQNVLLTRKENFFWDERLFPKTSN
ncbi:MAG: RES family NAD+ phosphorylase [Opitutaceae bacterium]|nr:RES family NAD+ phosphorylase [Cytophagales bacterium]